MTSKWLLTGLFTIGSLAPLAGKAESLYIADDVLTIDNSIEEAWGDALIDDGEDDTTRNRYCWVSAATWTTITDPSACSTYIYDPLGQIDITNAWARMNETNLYFAYESAATSYTILNQATGEPISLYNSEVLALAGITGLPEAFDHKFVFAFDTNPDETEAYDWYVVANLVYDFGTGIGPGDNPAFMQLFSESGATAGFQAEEDTLATNLELTDFDTAEITDPSQVDPMFELRMNIEKFYDTTGIATGDEVGLRVETHSAEADYTPRALITFVDAPPLPNKPKNLDAEVGTIRATLSWKKPGNTTPTYYTVQVRKNGVKNTAKWTTYKRVEKTQKIVKGLTAGTSYQFRVKACITDGCSAYTSWSGFTTD